MSTIIRIHDLLDAAVRYAADEVAYQVEEEALTEDQALDLLNPLRGYVATAKVGFSHRAEERVLEAIQALRDAVEGTDLGNGSSTEALRVTTAFYDGEVA